MIIFKRHPLLISSLIFMLLLLTFKASAQIEFSRYRISLDEKQRNYSLLVLNSGKIDSRCTLGYSYQQVQKNGDTKPVKKREEIFNNADKLIRYSPSRVTIAAGGSQTVRLTMRRRKNQVDGEYISYLKIACREIVTAKIEEGLQQNMVTTRVIYNIPIVARVGKLSAIATLSDAKVLNNELKVLLNRKGDRSLYGKITVTDHNNDVIGTQNGVAVFLPVTMQQVTIKLEKSPRGPLKIKFEESKREGGNQKSSLTLNL
ncbi:MAG: hypothetical protein HRU23_10785 [Gammaproteobacteria bacterium]|nr:hypothetical protein [Gammaproteobacteria bacterium]